MQAKWAVGTAVALLLSACMPTKQEASPTEERPSAPLATPDTGDEAQRLINLAASAQPPLKQEYLLRAADAYLDAGHSEQAIALAGRVQAAPLGPTMALRRELVLARADLMLGKPEQALQRLPSPPADLPEELRARALALRADAFSARGNYLESARERVWREALLAAPEARHDNHQRIWRALNTLNPIALRFFQSAGEPGDLNGWLELAALVKEQNGDAQLLRAPLEEWRSRNPGHPALQDLYHELLGEQLEPNIFPRKVALLLPLSGKLEGAGKALRDGFMAAYYRAAARGVELEVRFFDTAAEDAATLLQRAAADGVEFVVGPLAKEEVRVLAAGDRPPMPILTLNYTDDGLPTPATLYQFALSPEEDARAAADRAWASGHMRAATMAPAGNWGDRMLMAFNERWNEYGGEVLETQRYDGGLTDFSDVIGRLLDLDQSEARYQALKQTLRLKIEFEPRRRDDVEFIFLAAYPRQGRLVRPQLDFHHATDLPIFATSHIYTGVPNPAADKDMEGVVFCDAPWSITPDERRFEVEALWPQQQSSYSRLYAMGMDAFRLIPYLSVGARGPLTLFSGMTGNLRLDDRGRVRRELTCAHFVRGRPAALYEAETLVSDAQLDALREEESDEARERGVTGARDGGGAEGAAAPAPAPVEAR